MVEKFAQFINVYQFVTLILLIVGLNEKDGLKLGELVHNG